jgi:hypothetical protein
MAEWDDGWNFRLKPYITFTAGPFYINDVQGTATEQATFAYFNTATALSRSSNYLKMSKAGAVVGAMIDADDARTAGTATVQVRINGAGMAFDGGSCVLDGTNTTSASSFVNFASGVPFAAGDTIGCELVTSGWTPTSADVVIWLVVQLRVF